jgi:UDP-glucose 4-epimerase
MFGLKCLAFRFANVVGPKQTHGVGFDFLRRLKHDSTKLNILGNGNQSKSYIYVKDVVKAVLLCDEKINSGFNVFNVSTSDNLTVNQIADLVISELSLDSTKIQRIYSGGDRGWKADIPVVRLSTAKISKYGWVPEFTSHEAVKRSIREMSFELN